MNHLIECNSLSINGMEDSLAICFGSMKNDELTEYIMLQCKLKGDVANKYDEIYLEVNDQSSASFGGILKCILSPDSLLIDLNDKAARELGLEHCPAQLSIKLNLNDDELEELTYALSEVIFKDNDNFETSN